MSIINDSRIRDGITKDAHSSFLHTVLLNFNDCNETLQSLLVGGKELETIGQIILHAYSLFELFPAQLRKSAFNQLIFQVSSRM